MMHYIYYERGVAMQDAVPVGLGSMIAVLGAEISLIKELSKKETSEKDICEIANDNAEGQVILSGRIRA